jgi:predicted anti-sigma-YlaC factor YlaD
MTAHLTNEELTNRLLDMPSMTVDAHLLDCEGCRAELNQLRASVGAFRAAARGWGENAAVVGHSVTTIRPRRKRVWTAEWVVAAAFLLVLGVIPLLYMQDSGTRTQVGSAIAPASAEVSQAQIKQDNELLSAVNNEIAEGIPTPMQPLRVPLSYGSADSANQRK